jgi:proteasome subunit B (beta)-like protein
MTALVGVLCSDGVVIGTDSAASFAAGQTFTIKQKVQKAFVINDGNVIVAGTGQVGMGQRFNDVVQKVFTNGRCKNKRPLDIARELSTEARKDFSTTMAHENQFGALVGFCSLKAPQLCEFAQRDFQPELKDPKMWFVSMGSGQPITDPFLGLIKKAFFQESQPTLPEGIFTVNEHAEKRFAALESTHRRKVRDELKTKRRNEYRKLQQAGRDFTFLDWELPEEILEKPGGTFFEQHLYCNEAGKYQARLNTWETRVLSLWMKRTDFVGWLRNAPSKERSFCVPYEYGGWRRAFPDLIVLRREGTALVVDVLEPHRTNEDDTFAKTKGLAEFAEAHGNSFGRLMMLKVEGAGEKAVILGFDVNDPSTRKKALKLRSNEDVQGLFQPLTA